jgi:hypothetical protein
MDPLQPILPVAPNISPITPAPMVGRVGPDSSRSGAGQDKRRRRRPQPDRGAEGMTGHELDYAVDFPEDEDDSGLHIDVTA